MRRNSDVGAVGAGIGAAVIAAAVIVFALIPAFVAMFSFSKTDGGHVAVVRNGGPFDDNSIRQFLPASSGITYTGLYSSIHGYPAQSRYYDIVPGGDDRPGVNAYRTPTKDGVDVGLTARINFTLNTDEATLRKFDDAFGTRTFAVVNGEGSALAPWEGDEGFATFLDVIVKPIIEETLRQQVGGVDCSDLQASCALVQNSTPEQIAAAAANQQTNAQVLQAIQQAVNTGLQENINARLGGNYLANIQFSLTGVDLPGAIRERILGAQAEFAGASSAQAKLNSARLEADANAERERGYIVCPTCAEIDRIRAEGEALSRIPPGVSVYAPGGGAQVAIGAR